MFRRVAAPEVYIIPSYSARRLGEFVSDLNFGEHFGTLSMRFEESMLGKVSTWLQKQAT